jgi:hypothetical protein
MLSLMAVPRSLLSVMLGLLTACGTATSQNVVSQHPTAAAAGPAASMNVDPRCDIDEGSSTPVASYATTIRDLRAWLDREAVKVGANRWSNRAPDEVVLLCWYDGFVAKSPPPDPEGRVAAPFDRYAMFVDPAGARTMVVAGYADRLPVEAPHP